MKTVRAGLVQMRCEKGAIAANLDAISHTLAAAAALDVDILGFPEMSITGYVDPTQYPGSILRLDGPETAQLLEITRGLPTTLLARLPLCPRRSPPPRHPRLVSRRDLPRTRSRDLSRPRPDRFP